MANNRFKKAAETLVRPTEEVHEKLVVENEPPVKPAEPVKTETKAVPDGENIVERYTKLVEIEEPKPKARVSLHLPVEVKAELDQMVENKEIKNLNHFINYLVKNYLDNRKAKLEKED